MSDAPGPIDDAGHWDELQDLFARFADTPPAQREAALTAACPDARLRGRVLDLLRSTDAMAAGQPPSRPPRLNIGPYRLVREIGSGGVGTVYLAERSIDGVGMRAALKILAPHAADASFVERFHRERQNLAALDHPNITRLLDAGIGDKDQPYLVMEFVDGAQLDEYCDAGRLGIDARLRLFLQICDAVSHAHRNLIVHLDLKPSNVLITGDRIVKLLDFGTSKLIQMDDGATSTIMATPAYASPEQLLNLPVSTASDIYGLGAVLFALLTGRAPFGRTSASARIESAAREAEPESITKVVSQEAAVHRGSTAARLRQALRGDLAAIVAQCLRSRPADRYATVRALSDDIERHLACQPVFARRQSFAYKAGKFVRRHRVAVLFSVALATAVAVSAAFAWNQQRLALRDAERAVRMQTFLSSLFKMANPDYTGKPVATVAEFLRAGIARLPEFIHDPADLRQSELGLAESMFESGDLDDARAAFSTVIASATRDGAVADKVEAESYAGTIEYMQGNIKAGRTLAADALALAKSAAVPPRLRVMAQIDYAYNEDNNGFRTDANLELLRAAVKESADDRLPPRDRTLALKSLAADVYMRGDNVEAKAIFERLLPLYDGDPLALCDESEAYAWLAWISNTRGEVAASLPLFKKAYEGHVACAGADSRGALDVLPYWSDALMRLGRAPEAVAMLEKALPTWRRVIGDSSDQSEMLYFLARGLIATGRYAEAEAAAADNLGRLTGKLADDDRTIGTAHMVLGEALAGQKRYREALPHAKAAVDILVKSAVSTYGHELAAEATRSLSRVQNGIDLNGKIEPAH